MTVKELIEMLKEFDSEYIVTDNDGMEFHICKEGTFEYDVQGPGDNIDVSTRLEECVVLK